jgi:hypothetical protein
MKVIKKNLVDSFVFSKICISQSQPFADSSHLHTLIGNRSPFFSIINPFLLKTTLKSFLLVLERCFLNKFNVIFIANIEDKILWLKFYQACKIKNITLIKSSDVSLGFLTNRNTQNAVIVTLFLAPLKMEAIQKEVTLMGLPLVSLGCLLTCKDSSLLHVGGNYGLFEIQNLIVTLITICLFKKNESS